MTPFIEKVRVANREPGIALEGFRHAAEQTIGQVIADHHELVDVT